MGRAGVVTLVVAGSWLAVQAPVEAADTAAICHVEVHGTVKPGVWATRATEGSTSQSKPGTIVCSGIITGHRLAPEPGRFTMSFRFGNDGPGPGPISSSDCFHGWTAGQWAASIPTMDGETVDLAGTFGGAWAGLAWRADGRLGDHDVVAVGETRGDPDIPRRTASPPRSNISPTPAS